MATGDLLSAMASSAWLVFPNQLFKSLLSLSKDTLICLVEEPLFFRDEARSTTFAKIKLCYTRATMKSFEARLLAEGFSKVVYLPYKLSTNGGQLEDLLLKHADSYQYYNVVDNMLQAKLDRMTRVKLTRHASTPMFLFDEDDLAKYKSSVKGTPFFQTSFYRHFRHQTGFLMNKNGTFAGGRLSFDSENRLKMPAGITIPAVFSEMVSDETKKHWAEAKSYVENEFPDHPGDLKIIDCLIGGKIPEFFAIDHESAEVHLDRFITERLKQFGPYQDAIVDCSTADVKLRLQKGTLFHSCISPYINCGLLTPQQVLDRTVALGQAPIQSLEGFVRQILGWREYIRFVYMEKGEEMRSSNQLGNSKALDSGWYEGRLGVPPVDDAIKFAFKHGYLHHILRLMVVANFMNLSRIHPREMFRWFLDFSLDAYDWVMIGNVYGMASFASPIMSTKPYISSSNYVLKMSDYKKGPWCGLWDALYYHFLQANEEAFSKNHRMGLMLANLRKKSEEDKKHFEDDAMHFLKTLSNRNKRPLES